MSAQRLGVFVCQCGGNISDHVDVETVRAEAGGEEGVVTARSFMFACSDAAQQEMIDAIREEQLDGIVVASCSPKLHLETFRAMARRGGLNPYMYTQVNLREQCSWVHRRDMGGATTKATRLVNAGVARTRLARPLERLSLDTVPAVLVVGGGVAGLRAALALSEVGLAVHLVERSTELGGHVRKWGPLFPADRTGADLVRSLTEEVRRRDDIAVYTNAELVEKSGSAGRFAVAVRAGMETVRLTVGAIVVATGFDPYAPAPGELGRGHPAVVTLPEFKEMLTSSSGPLQVNGRRVRTIAYIYCVGSRSPGASAGADVCGIGPQPYCSRYCCTAAVHTALQAQHVDPSLDQYHVYRDMRTYGKYELLYEEAGRAGSIFVRIPENEPPVLEAEGDGLVVRVRDELAAGEEIEIPADLVVHVTGMVGGDQEGLRGVLGLPAGAGGFFNEVHPKLRPVETAVEGIFVAGAAQGPRTVAESVTSALAAASKCSAMLLRGHLDREPIVASVTTEACTWCGECAAVCPQEDAIVLVEAPEGTVAEVRPELCVGCGACVPACAAGAIEVEGYTHAQMEAMIDALAEGVEVTV